MSYIEASNISKSFESNSRVRHVLDHVSLSVDRGEFVSIVGFMGCGKSTLLNVLSGVLKPDTGHITIDGERVEGVGTRASIVFQNYSLLPWFSALENVRLAVQAAYPDKSRAEQRAQAERYLGMVGLGGALHRRPSQLSGGMRQRVAIARAFATHPEVLFLDEPFGALDALTRGNLQQELARLCQPADASNGNVAHGAEVGPVTTVMITNNLEEALLLSDRIIPMTRGPRATLGVPVAVELQRPRTAAQLMHDEQAIRARAHVVESLTDQMESARGKKGSDPLFADGVKRGSDPLSLTPPLAAAREAEL